MSGSAAGERRAATGVVAAGSPGAADAAAELLRSGGNAFDAAIGAGFAASVAEPGLCSLAGGGFLLARVSDTDGGSARATLFDFFVDTPGRGRPPSPEAARFDEVVVRFDAAEQRFHCGLGSVAVPGCLTGFLHVHERLGRLPLAAVVAPAVRLAHHGAVMAPKQADILALLEPILMRTAPGRALFAPTGRLVGAGERFTNPELGDFLTLLGSAEAPSFAKGWLAQAVVAAMGTGPGVVSADGMVTAQDLAAYRVIERAPLAVSFGDRTLLTNPPPSFGGSLLGAAIGALVGREAPDGHDPATRHDPASATGLDPVAVAARVVETMIRVDQRRAAIVTAASGTAPNVSRGTTHISVADADGNVASMTTSNGEGSGDLIAGTGIMFNNMLGEDDLHPQGFHVAEPGQRVSSMMAPSVLVDSRGRAELALGSGGSKRIRSALLQVLVNVAVRGLSAGEAVAAPRLHWDVDHLEVEPGFHADVLAELGRFGPVHVWPQTSMYFGGVHAVAPGDDGAAASGGGDPRRDGAVRVVEVSGIRPGGG